VIRILVVDDSPTVRELLVAILGGEPDFQVVGEARDGVEAVTMAVRLHPDIVTMDVRMPRCDGLEATKEIMARAPVPILVVSSGVSDQEVQLSLDATRAGALMVMAPPGDPQAPGFEARRDQLVAMVRAMASVKVVRRWPGQAAVARVPAPVPRVAAEHGTGVVAITASTGGPAALQRVLMDLPRDYPVPILIVQHIARGFMPGLCGWLKGRCDLRVRIASDGETLEPRTVYLAPDDVHLGVRGSDRLLLSPAPPIGGFRPSATFLFESVAQSHGSRAVAVVLTGMGRDGVAGLGAVRTAGGLVLTQDEASSVVYGMPREAKLAGLSDMELPLTRIAERLIEITPRTHG
jgi:two-component system chemotaxis response regulator CheB